MRGTSWHSIIMLLFLPFCSRTTSKRDEELTWQEQPGSVTNSTHRDATNEAATLRTQLNQSRHKERTRTSCLMSACAFFCAA